MTVPPSAPRSILVLAGMLAAAAGIRAGEARDLVVLDEDWNVPGDAICESNIPLLLHSSEVQLLALTGVTGDAWCHEGVANALRFMEEVGRTDIPVARGATWPLRNTPRRLAAWEQRFGALSWRGAWNSRANESGDPHPDTPYAVRAAREGLPLHAPAPESAAALMVRLVHEHPHQVTFACGGPLTNLAWAVRRDPEFSRLAKRLVLGLSVGGVLTEHPGSPKPNFNEMFDPEAAHVVLTAGWDEVVVIDTANSDPPLTAAIVDRIQQHPTAASNFLVANGKLGLPLWTMHVALVADPTLARSVERRRARLDIGTDDQAASFGSVVLDDAAHYPGPAGGQVITWVYAVETARYVDDYVRALQAPELGPRPPEFAAGIYPRK